MGYTDKISQATGVGAAQAGVSGGPAYTPEPTNWYKSLPYGFAFNNREASVESFTLNTVVMFLPILPSNINIVTHFATNIVTTLYGVVEEHSEVRYYDITIAGTTGIAPQHIDAQNRAQPALPIDKITSTGRDAFANSGIDLGGFLPEVTNTINQVKNAVSDIGNALTGGPKMDTGVDVNKTGYMAFHNFYRFLLDYKKDAAGVPGASARKIHPLQFLNYKDRIRYDVVPQSFTFTKSADNPMLYNYNIKLRGYNLRDIDSAKVDSTANQLAQLGLGDIKGQSAFSSLTSAVGSATALISGLL